jgi:hypothetical protein
MKTKNKTIGRPKLTNPANERLPHIRVTKEQLDNYRSAATEYGKSLSGWVKDTLDREVEL